MEQTEVTQNCSTSKNIYINLPSVKKQQLNSTPDFSKKENALSFNTTPYKRLQQDKDFSEFAADILKNQSPLIDL